YCSATSTPICPGPACSVSTAVSGSASPVTWEPASDTLCPAHSSRKSRFCESDMGLRGPPAPLLHQPCNEPCYQLGLIPRDEVPAVRRNQALRGTEPGNEVVLQQ